MHVRCGHFLEFLYGFRIIRVLREIKHIYRYELLITDLVLIASVVVKESQRYSLTMAQVAYRVEILGLRIYNVRAES